MPGPWRPIDEVGDCYNECRDDTVDYIACMDCFMKGGIARRAVTVTVGWRWWKKETISIVDRESIWKKQLNWIGTKCGKILNVSRSLSRKVVTRAVPVWTITEGAYTWTKLLSCHETCSGK